MGHLFNTFKEEIKNWNADLSTFRIFKSYIHRVGLSE